MALFFKQQSEDTILGVWKMSESLEEIQQHPYAFPFVEQAKDFKSENRQKEWLSVRVLIHTLLDEKKEIEYDALGAPYLADRSYHIGITHTVGFVAVILAKTSRVAIDIELISDRVHRLAHRVFHSDEFFYPTNDFLYYELLIWCAKETLFKLLGLSEIDFKSHIRVCPFSIGDGEYFYVQEFKTAISQKVKIQYRITDQYVLTYAKA
ncbi:MULTISPECIES: 4'-phosphopantetheinyl transferase family protein [Bacteroides]|uniref:4'-phosphopantetheinyl transferase family protein n=1 Tax=Bacteroides TaxID=816 RepID=UPI001DE8BE2A|nr:MULTISPECIES: 4'-phosphopantetheinyl transferase superfamily protein [Bacteroides]HJD91319.1 4'-phosphopantetheinyl transferase superfamily protein [Bacteroides coprosuis]